MVREIFCTSGMVRVKAGRFLDGNISGAKILYSTDPVVNWIEEAQSLINVACRYNFSDNYATLNDDTKKILQEVASNIAAMYAISYNVYAYTSRIAAEDTVNILRDGALRGLSILRDKKAQDFINNG